MKEAEPKCSLEEHKDIIASKYCPECRIYICSKCENFHSPWFKNHHHPYNLIKENEIFTGFCRENNHPNKLEYFCKNHNQLCCGLCIAKLNERGEGQHKDCNICYIEKIESIKKNNLKENIKCLEELEYKFNESLISLKKIYDSIESDKNELKKEIQQVFGKIRDNLKKREDILLKEIDNIYYTKYFNLEIIKTAEKLPKQIKLSLEKGKLIDKEWNKENLSSCVNDCINIENNIKNINIINENINKCNIEKKLKLKFKPNGKNLDMFLDTINKFGTIYFEEFSFRECPININQHRKFIVTGENKNILTKISTNNVWTGVICKDELVKPFEEHKWKIKILNTYNNLIMVGLASSDFDIYSTEQFKTCGWYLNCSNSTLYSGPPFKYNNMPTNLSKVKNEVIVIMNLKKRALKFIINNEDKGDSYTNIPIDKPLFPAICLLNKDDSVEITEI